MMHEESGKNRQCPATRGGQRRERAGCPESAAVTEEDPAVLIMDEPAPEAPYWTQTRRVSVILYLAYVHECEEGRLLGVVFNPARALCDAQAAGLLTPRGEPERLTSEGAAILEEYGFAEPMDRDAVPAKGGGSACLQAAIGELDEPLTRVPVRVATGSG
jgi:hypothetical protein